MHAVVAGILRSANTALLVHRSPDRIWYPDTWDLPGGHVEDGELPRAALVRELHEELGVRAAVPAEHDDLRWVTLGDADELVLADPRLLALLAVALGRRATSGR